MENTLLRFTPESQGISSRTILRFIEQIEQNIHELHSFILLRHGGVVAEGWWSPYAPDLPHMLFSLSKSFTSTAIGLAVEEGRLSIDDFVLSYFPKESPKEISENLASMQIRHLLSMTTGHAEDTVELLRKSENGNWAQIFLSLPVEYAPGTHFLYNSGATYILSAILQKVTGERLVDYLQPRLFEPLGIQNPQWEISPQGINTGGWGLSLKTEDVARFGQLYLQKGLWKGQRLVPETWVKQATSFQSDNSERENPDWAQGYGYQFWLCRHGAYRGDGAFGQFCVVMPDQEAVLAITGGMDEMQPVLDIVWDVLLPGFQATPIPIDSSAKNELSNKLACLQVDPPHQPATLMEPTTFPVKAFAIDPNPLGITHLRFDVQDHANTLTIHLGEGFFQLDFKEGVWEEAYVPLINGIPPRAVISGSWTAKNTYTVAVRFLETPFHLSLVCQFEQNRLIIEPGVNVILPEQVFPVLVGHANPS